MNGNHLLDTNIIIALFAKDTTVIANIKKSINIFIPVIAIGELFYGAYNSTERSKNIEKIFQFQNDANILKCDTITGNIYGQIKKELKEKGNPIPENDIWIAAIAIQHKLTLVSRDKHFEKIARLSLIKW